MMDYFSMYGDVWKFHKSISIRSKQMMRRYGEQIANEADVLTTKYDRCRFIVNLVMTELEEFERLYRE